MIYILLINRILSSITGFPIKMNLSVLILAVICIKEIDNKIPAKPIFLPHMP